MMKLAIATALLTLLLVPRPAEAEPRPLSLPAGKLRVDVAPPDYGFMDHGMVNGDRGLRIFKLADVDTFVSLGAGGAYGVTNELEVGTLLLPLQLSPDGDFGDIEVYGRYVFLQGSFSVGGQLTLLLPTQTDFGLGLGLPVLLTFGGNGRLESGIELELVSDFDIVNLDVPVAVNFEVSPDVFFGGRSGLFFFDMDEAAINLGVQGGATVAQGVVLSGSFNWPAFIQTGPGDTVNVDTFEIILGANFYIDV